MKTVLSFGAGVQSTTILGLACKDVIPRPDLAVFADPQFDGSKTYRHLEWCKELAAKHGIRIEVVTAGNIEKDATAFARLRANADVKRYASIPMFIKSRAGKDGVLPRQCTSEYKIEPIERFHRREALGLAHRQRAPKTPAVEVWIGISADEPQRATPPGRWKEVTVEDGTDLVGRPCEKKIKVWKPVPWQVKAFPLLGVTKWPDRSETSWPDDATGFPEWERPFQPWDRDDCKNWLAAAFPRVEVPRSACICCPYRGNAEWRQMRDESPEDFARAVAFDAEIRESYAAGRLARGELAGVPYLHRTMIPLGQVNLEEQLGNRKGCGGLWDQEPDGICGV